MKEMADAMSGASKAGKKIILEADVEYIQTGMNSKDMDFKEAQLMNARYIAMALGVPPQIINLAGNDSTFSNYEQATLSFYQDTIIPMTQTIINALNRWLGVYYKKDGVYLDIDYASISALDYTRREKDKAAIELKGAGIISTNEARLRIGEEIYDNAGDKILVSGANVPLEVAEEADFTNEAEQDFADEQSGKEKV
jgi:HK97 family phage portal protein